MKKEIQIIMIGVLFLFFEMGRLYAIDEEIKPTKDQLIIINKSVNQLAFYEDGELKAIKKVATGQSRDLTPEGEFTVIKLIKNQPYYKLKIPGGDPRNPLGPRWIGLDVPGTWGYTYGIHGNNASWTIGTYASAGCVRMYNEDVIWLYDQLELGAKVIITRTTGQFDEIARNRGYLITEERAHVTSSKVKWKETVSVFERPRKTEAAIGVLEPNMVTPLLRYKDWFYVEYGEVKGWVKEEAVFRVYSMKEITRFHVNRFLETQVIKQMMEKIKQTAPVALYS